MRNVLFVVFGSIVLYSCSKKNDDVFSLRTVHGTVKNNCNDSLLEGIEVLLGIYKGTKQIDLLKALTKPDGKFEFKDVQFYEKSEYKYKISIDAFSNQDYEFSGLDKQEVAKILFEQEWKLGVTYTFKYLTVKMQNGITLNENDSLRINFTQKTLHNNQPSSIWQVSAGNDGYGGFGNYWMGPWEVTVLKWKDGIYSEIEDSIYMGKGETKDYIIPW